MQNIPAPVLQYLATKDSLIRAQIAAEHPDLQQILGNPATRSAILDWLRSEAAWEPSAASLVSNCLELLRGGSAEETPVVRPFVLHPDPFVRIGAFEVLLSLYYPDKNPHALLLVFQNMLSDNADNVRSLAAHYIETIQVTGELKEFLERWHKNARNVGWEATESFERIGRILKNPQK
jgi:HEAT repeat protein